MPMMCPQTSGSSTRRCVCAKKEVRDEVALTARTPHPQILPGGAEGVHLVHARNVPADERELNEALRLRKEVRGEVAHSLYTHAPTTYYYLPLFYFTFIISYSSLHYSQTLC